MDYTDRLDKKDEVWFETRTEYEQWRDAVVEQDNLEFSDCSICPANAQIRRFVNISADDISDDDILTGAGSLW